MLSSLSSNWFTAWARRFRQQPTQTGWVMADRFSSYAMWDAYVHNSIYNVLSQGGQRENVNAILGNAAAADLAGLYNPVYEVVSLYQHVFGGTFGVDITVQSDNPKLLSTPRVQGQPAPPPTPLEQIWQWSNIQQAKQVLCSLAPTHGNVGLRIVARNAIKVNGQFVELPPDQRRIYIKPEHPKVIRDIERDERGNVIAAEFEYDLRTGLGDDSEVETIRERMTKEQFQTWTVKPGGILEPRDSYPNDLGVVPYVLLDHQPSGETWGLNAFYRAAPLIDRLNALATHINVQIHRHVKAKLAVAASGAPPTSFDLGDMTIAYFNTALDATPPTFEWLVAPLNIADSIEQSKQLQEQLEDRLPELKATAGKFLANQSGETVAQLRKPAEDRLALARVNYEDGLVRAQQIALSEGVLYGFWDLGTGTGTREAADRAFRSGVEDHVFNDRELLPLTETERLAVAESKSRLGLSRKRVMTSIGLTDEEAAANEAEMENQQMAATNAFMTGFDRA